VCVLLLHKEHKHVRKEEESAKSVGTFQLIIIQRDFVVFTCDLEAYIVKIESWGSEIELRIYFTHLGPLNNQFGKRLSREREGEISIIIIIKSRLQS